MSDRETLTNQLLASGLSRRAIDAAWPTWWTEEVDQSPSGKTELRFALARRLGLKAAPLIGERVEFVWKDEACFKHLSPHPEINKAALTSFATSIGHLLLLATTPREFEKISASKLREAILRSGSLVDLHSLITVCWAIGIPVIYLRVFPLSRKNMHAMVISSEKRFAILLGRDSNYPAPVAFTLAHELGHIMLGHLAKPPALVDMDDPAKARSEDREETEADHFALTLLTGDAEPRIQTNLDHFNAPMLAKATVDAAEKYMSVFKRLRHSDAFGSGEIGSSGLV